MYFFPSKRKDRGSWFWYFFDSHEFSFPSNNFDMKMNLTTQYFHGLCSFETLFAPFVSSNGTSHFLTINNLLFFSLSFFSVVVLVNRAKFMLIYTFTFTFTWPHSHKIALFARMLLTFSQISFIDASGFPLRYMHPHTHCTRLFPLLCSSNVATLSSLN